MLRTEWSPTQLAAEGMANAEQAADPRVIAWIDMLITAHITAGVRFSANDIRKRITITNRGLVGARVNAAAMRRPRVMVKVGEEPSDLPSTHGKKIAVWVGVQ